MDSHNGDKLLIASIFKQAFSDILHAPMASIDPSIKYRAGSKLYFSADAKKFINKDNESFIYYCDLLDLDAGFAETNFYKMINHATRSPSLLKVLKNVL